MPAYCIEQMCDPCESWVAATDAGRTLYPTDRLVFVDALAAFPGIGQPMTGVPMWVRAYGAYFRPWMPARQIGWLRCYDNTFRGIIQIAITSANRRSAFTATLLLPPEAFQLTEPH